MAEITPEDKLDLDIRVVTPFNVQELAELTGKTKDGLLRKYWDAKNDGKVLLIVMDGAHKPEVGSCYYNWIWNEAHPETGRWICAVHNQESKHPVTEGLAPPCLAVDPYP